MDVLFLIIGLVVGAVAGVFGGVILARRQAPVDGDVVREDPAVIAAKHTADIERVRAENASQLAGVQSQLAASQATITNLREQGTKAEEQFREQIQALRDQQRSTQEQQRIDQAERVEREKREAQVLQALAPVRATLDAMQRKVTELEQQRSQQYGSLSEQLKQAHLSDEALRATTESLASALRSNNVRGVWGETQLRRVVEAAGLTQHVDFETQMSITSDAGAGRPDMVIQLPGGKSIAVDAKVPFDAYLEASQIPVTAVGEEGARRKQLLEKHVKAMRGHIDALAKKTYWEGLAASPEFVVAFVPSESLLSAALEADPTILDYSFGKRVALASPVNLWAVLKTVAYTWQQQAVSDEAKRLFDLGNTLYQRLGALAGHADGLRRAIERTVDSYNKFAASLESRVLVTARQFPGIDETKLIDEAEPIHATPRKLTALELESPAVEPVALNGSDTTEETRELSA
ncbi:DNA recombination protein RmuC [Humibacter ginsenosidimutans]|uniref:DNA recombination protein RmuC n=1 Tax=Humibacter ginsenosidimutans TaxID=2599293 RepID=A0A5B8M223_9MICO|nr:DNA recombination protein RmuC [Humibacter ginsenosidimutans]QDZ14403.1 DNA recombination protein RmuC [Humibacter ginsenosidimutans]